VVSMPPQREDNTRRRSPRSRYSEVSVMQKKTIGSFVEEDRLTDESLSEQSTSWKPDWGTIVIILLAILQLVLSAARDR
jgi:hypothetical protein